MKKVIFLFAAFLLVGSVFGQEETKTIRPILVDKSALSGVGLKKIDLKDEPEKEFYQRNLYWGKDLGVFVVSTENWVNEIVSYPFDEFVYMYQGEAIVKPEVGSNQVFYSGDYFFANKGFKGQWEINAGKNLHYELSVITTSRSDTLLNKENPQHKLFSRAKLSGNGIILNEEGFYAEVLEKGNELTIQLKAEKPNERALDFEDAERVIHVLAGQINITDEEGATHQFYSGDFFIMPKGCKGTWMSDGHQMVKYLRIEKTN